MTIKQVVVGLISSAIQLLGYIALFQLDHKLCVAVLLIHFGEFIDHQLEHSVASQPIVPNIVSDDDEACEDEE